MSWSLRTFAILVSFTGLLWFFLAAYTELPMELHGILTPQASFSSTDGADIFGEEYLVNTEQCKIPDVDPWNLEVKHFYIKKDYVECSRKKKLTRIKYMTDGVYVEVDAAAKREYHKSAIYCCYSNITMGQGATPDLDVSLSECSSFETKVKLSEVSILVRCKTSRNVEVYVNTHSLLPKSLDIERKLKSPKKSKPTSVLLIGIDSLSRLNFHRAFSNTKRYLEKNSWIEYKGYNKVGDNTLPNLMAMLTGRNLSNFLKECDPKDAIQKCNFIWEQYSKSGYITAYAEDETNINTFTTYSLKGFSEKPVDFYFTPYLRASENLLPVERYSGMTYCVGEETSAERVLKVVNEMVVNYPRDPKFGFFWMNSFSHDDINAPGRIDKTFVKFLTEIQPHINDNTIVIFFSDHGIRFGDIRLTRTGWFEERLPFLYFWIPDRFKRRFSALFKNLVENAIKLTTPYDVYLTLQQILELNDLNYVAKPSDACPNCKSLLARIEDRSCKETSIPFHFCTCLGYSPLNAKSETIGAAAAFAIEEINTLIDRQPSMRYKCEKFVLKSVISAAISATNVHNKTFLLVMLETVPRAKFEMTFSLYYDVNGRYFINEGGSSRLDQYSATSSCMSENKYAMYCYCKWNILWHFKFLNFWFEI